MLSATLVGPTAKRVQISAVAGPGHGLFITGLANREVREAAARVTHAIQACGFSLPEDNGRVTVHLAPSDVPKSGAALDLGIALSVLSAIGAVPNTNGHVMALGELGLSGELEHTSGVLALAAAAPEGGTLLVPDSDLGAATLAKLQDKSLRVLGARKLPEAIAVCLGRGGRELKGKVEYPPQQVPVDMAAVLGHEQAKRAILAAGVGGMHVLLSGPPGCGKSLLSRAAPSILPRLSEPEALEVSRLWSAAGELQEGRAIVHPPYVQVTPNTTQVGLIGGGAHAKAIGAAVRSHRGILHIDEIQDMDRQVVDSLRGIMEDGTATVVRQGIAAKFPARCWVIATMNPCPCGWFGLFQCRDCGLAAVQKGNCTACSGETESRCQCTAAQVRKVQAHVSGPMLDRFDVRLTVPPPSTEGKRGATSSDLRKAVARARKVLAMMLSGKDMREVPGYEVAEKFSRVATEIEDAMPRASLRRKHRTLKLSLALAAIDGQGKVGKEHIREAARMSRGD